MEIIPNRRALFTLLIAFLIISLVAFSSNLYSSSASSLKEEAISTVSQDHLEPQIPTVADDAPSASNADVDEPEPEDLEIIDTKPTDAKDWKPKTFPPLPANIQKIVQANVRKSKGDNILLTAVVNSGMADYTLNWIESLKRTKQDDKFLVFAIDEELETILKGHGYGNHVVQIPEAWFHKDLSAGFSKWLDPNYTPITHSKTLVVEQLLYDGITVWFSDVDIVFTSPTIYDYLVMKLNSRRKFTEFLTTQETEQMIINSGFYIMRPTDTNKRILADTIMIQDNEPTVTQQRAMNRVLDELNLSYQTSSVALLDLTLFPHGRMFFERNIPHKYGFEPMIVHANYRVGEEKKKSLQKADLWYI